MINNLRLLIFYVFAVIGGAFILFGTLFLSKRQLRTLKDVFHSLEDRLEVPDLVYHQPEPQTIEDEIYNNCLAFYSDMYKKGTNEDLSIECCNCGKVTKRGDYYVRNDVLNPDIPLPKMFICPECYNKLPHREGRSNEQNS